MPDETFCCDSSPAELHHVQEETEVHRLKYLVAMLEQLGEIIPQEDNVLLSYLIAMSREEAIRVLQSKVSTSRRSDLCKR